MAHKYIGGARHPIYAWTEGVEVEEKALEQLRNVASLPFIHKHISVMPDVHWGMGATVGSVIPTKGAIVPAAIGVDLGCGMQACKIKGKAEEVFKQPSVLRAVIEKFVPHGRTDNGGRNDRGAWGEPPSSVGYVWSHLKESGFKKIIDKHPAIAKANNVNHLGTLGTGNHFIEVCLGKNDDVWVMLHSGSRGVGNRIGTYFIERARKEIERYFIDLPDRDLAYLAEGTQDFDDYIEAMLWAQKFAYHNRCLMMDRVMMAMGRLSIDVSRLQTIDCHHNYCQLENHFGANVWVTRKGAVLARKGALGLIPGSMGTRSYVVRGKGNPDSFHSCSHGAGRKMSRAEAKRKFTLDDHIKATEGIECRKDESVIDETPAAYKNIDQVMRAQEDLVEVVHTLRQVVCVKG